MRIIRTIVLLTAVVVFMPSPPEEHTDAMTAANPPMTQFFGTALSMIGDVRDFCGRQATICGTAHYVSAKLEVKTKYGVELLYAWANEKNGDAPARDESGITTAAGEPVRPGQNTLELEDLIPDWRPPAHQG